MIETNIFERWLDAEAERVGQKLAENKHLEPDDKLTIVLKGLTNHVAHLDVDLRDEIKQVRTDLQDEMSKRFEQVDKRFEQVDKRFEQVDKRFEQVDKRFERLENDVKDLRKEVGEVRKDVLDVHKALNNQVWKIVGALSFIGAAFSAAGYVLKLWR